MKLSEILTPETVRIPLASSTKEDVLRELVGLLPSSANETMRDVLLAAVIERESRMSTGIGQGIAIPHGKSDQVPAMEIVFGIAPTPIDFDALDGNLSRFIFLLVSPKDAATSHVQALATMARLLKQESVQDDLLRAGTPAEVEQILIKAKT